MIACSGAMTACRSDVTRPYQTTGRIGVVRMCDMCAEAGRRLGMSLRPVPEWIARAQEHKLPARIEGGLAW